MTRRVSRGSRGLSKEQVNKLHKLLTILSTTHQISAEEQKDPSSWGKGYCEGLAKAFANAAELLKEECEGERP